MQGPKRNKAGLTAQEARFVAAYLATTPPSSTKAAVAAGYSATSAASQGSRMVRRPAIARAIELGQRKVQVEAEIGAAEVVRELARIGLSDIGGLWDEHGQLRPIASLPEDLRRAIASVEIEVHEGGEGCVRVHKVKLWDKPAALGLLCRKLGLLLDKAQIQGADGGPLEVVVRTLAAEPPKGGAV